MANIVTPHDGPLLDDICPAALWATVTWANGTRSLWPAGSHRCLVEEFFVDILNSSYMTALRETFSTPDHAIGYGTFLGTYRTEIRPRVSSGLIDDSDIQATLEQDLTDGYLPTSAADTCYFVMVPPDVAVTFRGDRTGVDDFFGYHNSFTTVTGEDLFYCVISPAGPFTEELLTVSISHELAEQITDPVRNTGWFGPNIFHPNRDALEVCDYCSGSVSIRGYSVNQFVLEGSSSSSFQCGPGTDHSPRGKADSASISFDKSLTRTSCLGSIIEGQSVYFQASASHLGQPAIIEKIAWSCRDQNQQRLQETRGNQERIYSVIVPSNTTSVTVRADMTISLLGCLLSAEKTFPVVTQTLANAQEQVCAVTEKLRDMLAGEYSLPPYWPLPPILNPERDLTVDPLRREEFDQLMTSIRKMETFVKSAQPMVQDFAEVQRFLPEGHD